MFKVSLIIKAMVNLHQVISTYVPIYLHNIGMCCDCEFTTSALLEKYCGKTLICVIPIGSYVPTSVGFTLVRKYVGTYVKIT